MIKHLLCRSRVSYDNDADDDRNRYHPDVFAARPQPRNRLQRRHKTYDSVPSQKPVARTRRPRRRSDSGDCSYGQGAVGRVDLFTVKHGHDHPTSQRRPFDENHSFDRENGIYNIANAVHFFKTHHEDPLLPVITSTQIAQRPGLAYKRQAQQHRIEATEARYPDPSREPVGELPTGSSPRSAPPAVHTQEPRASHFERRQVSQAALQMASNVAPIYELPATPVPATHQGIRVAPNLQHGYRPPGAMDAEPAYPAPQLGNQHRQDKSPRQTSHSKYHLGISPEDCEMAAVERSRDPFYRPTPEDDMLPPMPNAPSRAFPLLPVHATPIRALTKEET